MLHMQQSRQLLDNMPTKLPNLQYGRMPGTYYHGLLSQPDCASCPLRNSIKVMPDGPIPARLAIIGEEPGRTELARGKGFVGPSGRLLWHMCKMVGIDRSEVWVTNSALCMARSVRLSNGAYIPKAEVKAAAAKACRRRLVSELLQVDPVVAIPLGNWALWALTDIPKAKIYSYRGSRLDIDLNKLLNVIDAGLTRAPSRSVK